MPVRRLLSIAAATTLLLGVAACDPEGKDEPPTAASSAASDGGGTTTGESTSTKPSDGGGDDGTDGGDKGATAIPDVPEPDPADFPGMDKHTGKGAEQAFRYYWAMVIWGYQTGETKTLRTLYEDSCGNCAENTRSIEALRNRHKYWGDTQLGDVKIDHKKGDPDEIDARYAFTISEHSEPDESGEGSAHAEEELFAAAAGLNWKSGRWVIRNGALTGGNNGD